MEFLKKNKVVTALAVVAVLALMYYAFSSLGASPALSSTNDSSTSPVSQSLLTTLANLRTIHLDGSIFQNPSFVSLTDFGVVIAPENVGRVDPFAPNATLVTAVSTSPQNSKITPPALKH